MAWLQLLIAFLLLAPLRGDDPILKNGNLEQGRGAFADHWDVMGSWDPHRAPVVLWSPTLGVNASGGIMIRNRKDEPNDAYYAQTVHGLIPGRPYRVTALLKVEAPLTFSRANTWTCGATISRISTSWHHSDPLNEASPDWRSVEMTFTAETESHVIGCRLGYRSSLVGGTMFCDNVEIQAVSLEEQEAYMTELSAVSGTTDRANSINGTRSVADSHASYALGGGVVVSVVVLLFLCVVCQPFHRRLCCLADIGIDLEDDEDEGIVRVSQTHGTHGIMTKSKAPDEDLS